MPVRAFSKTAIEAQTSGNSRPAEPKAILKHKAVHLHHLGGVEIIEEHLEADYIPRRFNHPYVFAIWFSHSERQLLYRNQWQSVPPGALMTLQAGESVEGGTATSFVAHKIVISPRVLCMLLGLNPEEPPYFPDLYTTDPRLIEFFLRTHRSLGESESPTEQQARLVELLSILIQHCCTPAPRSGGNGEISAMVRAKHFLDKHWNEEVTLEDLAREAHLNKYDLLKAFRKHLGITPHAYLICLRVEHAKELLDQGMPIAQVALEAGFSDQSHLTRMLKRYWHLTPGQFKVVPALT